MVLLCLVSVLYIVSVFGGFIVWGVVFTICCMYGECVVFGTK